jgi:hypothetical protein
MPLSIILLSKFGVHVFVVGPNAEYYTDTLAVTVTAPVFVVGPNAEYYTHLL